MPCQRSSGSARPRSPTAAPSSCAPEDRRTAFRLGELLAYRGDWPNALAVLAGLDPADVDASVLHCELGKLLFRLEYTARAMAFFDASLAAEPLQMCTNVHLALFEISAGELESARARIERLAGAHYGCCDQILGEIAYRQGRPADAASHWMRALETAVEPKSTLMRIRLAQLEGDAESLGILAAALERQLTAGVDIWFPALLLTLVSAELGDTQTALRWHGEATSRGYLDWRWDLAEPTFEALRGTDGFESAISRMRARIAEMRSEIEDRGLVETIRLPTTQSVPTVP